MFHMQTEGEGSIWDTTRIRIEMSFPIKSTKFGVSSKNPSNQDIYSKNSSNTTLTPLTTLPSVSISTKASWKANWPTAPTSETWN